jgi:hypothetical protein
MHHRVFRPQTIAGMFGCSGIKILAVEEPSMAEVVALGTRPSSLCIALPKSH